jgi:glycosyltransferase involved in cell wall biosynthesis
MPKTIEVLIVIDHLGAGGAQEFIYQLCSRFATSMVRLSVCAFHTGVYQKKLQALGISVHVLAPKHDPLSSFLAVVKLWALLGSHHYHIVNTVLQGSFAVATPLARLRGLPTVHSIMAVRSQLQHWYFFLLVWYQRWVKVYLTPIPKELITAGVFEDKIKMVEVTVDLTSMLNVRYDAQRQLEGLNLTKAFPVALSIGRLHPDKGHEYAIRAWPHVLAVWPKARLLIVGDGHDEARLKALAEYLGLEDSVLFTGYRSDVESLFSRADIFLRTSINEGVNLTVIQAMAAALPIVGFKNGAPKEIINNNINGLLVDLCDEHALSAAILQICVGKELAEHITRNGRAMVEKYYNIDSVAHFYKILYEGIAENRTLSSLEDMSAFMLRFEDYFADDSAYLK